MRGACKHGVVHGIGPETEHSSYGFDWAGSSRGSSTEAAQRFWFAKLLPDPPNERGLPLYRTKVQFV